MKLALLTGATGGLGKALAHLLAEKKIALLLTARDEKALKALAQELPTSVEWIACDLARDCTPLLKAIEEKAPDLVINNAGFGLYGVYDALPSPAEMLDVNIKAPLLITQKAIQTLKERQKPGTIINIASAAAYNAMPYFATYAASKTFLKEFSQALDAELDGSGIRVLVSCPGQIATSFCVRASNALYQNTRSGVMSPEKVAKAIWKQIERGKRVSIVDWRYSILVALSRLASKRWLQKRLAKSIQQRI